MEQILQMEHLLFYSLLVICRMSFRTKRSSDSVMSVCWSLANR